MWSPESKYALVVVWSHLALASLAVTRLWQSTKSLQQSDNQRRLFVPGCWVNQGRLHSAPWVLTQTRSCFLTSGHLHFYLHYSLVMHIHAVESVITLVFFCQQHSSQNWMYWPNIATSKYKLILRFITVNSIGKCIGFLSRTNSHPYITQSAPLPAPQSLQYRCHQGPTLKVWKKWKIWFFFQTILF